MGDVTADGGDFVIFDADVGEFIEFVEIEGAGGGELVFAVEQFKFGLFSLVELVLDVPDDFFHDVVESDDADGTAVFVHSECEVGMGFTEAMEQFVDREHFGDHEEVALDLAEVGIGMVEEGEQVFDVDEAEGFIQVAVDEGEAGVFGLDGELEIGLEVVFHIERDHQISWGHDVADAAVIESEDVKEDVFFGGCDIAGFFAFSDDVAEFFFGMGELGFGDGLDFKEPLEEVVGGAVEDPDGGFEEEVKEVEGGADGEGGLEGLANGEGFGHQLTKDDVEEGDDAVSEEVGAAGDDSFVLNAEVEETGLDEAIDEGLAEAAKGNAGEGDAELGGGKVTVQMVDLMTGESGAATAFAGGGLELGAAHFDDGKLGGHKEGVEQDEKKHGE